jgi:hypothetical protein
MDYNIKVPLDKDNHCSTSPLRLYFSLTPPLQAKRNTVSFFESFDSADVRASDMFLNFSQPAIMSLEIPLSSI